MPPLSDVIFHCRDHVGTAPGPSERFIVRNGRGLEAALDIRRTAYERGREVDYDGRPNYVNKLAFLATDGQDAEDLPKALLAHAILTIGGDRLFVAETVSERATQLVEGLGFKRICETGRQTRFGYLLSPQIAAPRVRTPQRAPSRAICVDRLGQHEVEYHDALKQRTGFDVFELLEEGWTTHVQYGHRLAVVATFGQAGEPAQAAFKLDVFDLASGAHIAYADTAVPGEGDFALQDDAIADFSCVIPPGVRLHPEDSPPLSVDAADAARRGWPQREGIWVRIDCRRAGIGQSLERIAGDLCKLAFPGVNKMGIIFPADNIKAHEFHCKASANNVRDPLYCLAYDLDSRTRPLIAIRHGL